MQTNKEIAEQIASAIKKTTDASPVQQNKESAEKIVAALNESKAQAEQPQINLGLGSMIAAGGGVSPYKMAKLAEASEPIDKSIGVNIPEEGTATEKIATNYKQGIHGATDYSQSVYGLGDWRGAASAGTAEGDVNVANLRAGDAGLNISTDSTLRDISGAEGNPALFGRRYQLLNTTVAPFKVKIPQYNLEVMSETMDPEKLAYQVATMIGGRNVPSYVGYTNAGFDITEPWYSGLIKKTEELPTSLFGLIHKTSLAAGILGSTIINYGQAGIDLLLGDKYEDVKNALNAKTQAIEDVVHDELDWWNKAVADYERRNNLGLTEFAPFSTTLVSGIPDVLGQVGLLVAIGIMTGGAGVSPAVSAALSAGIGGALFGSAQGLEDYQKLMGVPMNPQARLGRAAVGTAGSIALNSLGLWGVLGGRLSAARQFVQNYGKRMAAARLQGVGSMAIESLTEYGDQALEQYITYDMGDDRIGERLNERTMALVLGAVGGIVGIPMQARAERFQIAKEQILAGKIRADAPEFVKDLNEAVNALSAEGLYTKEDALEIIAAMASPEGQAYFKRKQNETLMGVLDRLSPDAVAYAKEIGTRQSAKIMENMAKMDTQVYNTLPKDMDESLKVMISRAMRGIAPLIELNGGTFRMPRFIVRNGEPMEYVPRTNTLYINTESTGEAVDLMEVTNKRLPTIDPVQRGILHELGHMLDTQLGKGTNYKEFLPTYFDAIAKVYGKEKAKNVMEKMPDEADRLAYSKSGKKADVAEKRMDKLLGQINEKDTGEYFAYALGRLGRRIGKAFGFDAAESAQYIDAANAIAMQLKIPSIQKQLTVYQNALNELIKKNDETLAAMAKAMGEDELARKIRDYAAGDINALAPEDVLSLYNILKTYTGVDGMKILEDAFQGMSPETFMERTEREFGESIKEGTTIDKLQEALKKKGETGQSENINETTINEDTFDVSQILGDMKKQRKSALEKRADEKPTGNDYATDAKEVMQIIKEAKPAPRWFAKLFGNGDINTALWSIGGKKLVDHFDLIGKMNRSDDEATGLMEEFDGRIKKALGFKNNIERDAFTNQASVESINVDYAIDPLTGDPISMKISPLVAMNVYLHAKNPKTRENMLNAFGGNEKQMQSVIDALTPEQKKYADTMQEFIKDKWTQYKKSFEQEGDTIEDEPYWPVVEAIHAATGDRKVNSNIARKEGKDYAISLDVDAREIFNTYVQRVAGADNHVYSTIRRIKDLMGYEKNEYTDDYPTQAREKLSEDMWNNSRRIRGLARANMGSEGRYDRFLALLDDFLAKREQSLVGSQSLNIAARNLTGGLLQWKPLQFMKNLANVSGFWGLADNQAQYWADTAWAATHPIEAAKYMMEKVPYIRNRYKGQNIDEMLTQQTAGTDSLLMNWAKRSDKLGPQGQKVVSNLVALTQASRRAGYTPMLSGDLASNVIGGYGLLKQYEAKYGDKAGDKLSEAIVKHQASSNQATRSLLQREWGRDIRGELARFSSEGIQKVKSMASAIAEAQQGERTAGNAAKEIASTLSSMILFALISAGVIDLFDNDEENDKEVYESLGQEGISAIVGGSVVGNSVIAPIISSLFGGRGDIGTPMSKILTQDLRKLSKGDWDDAVIDGISATVPIVGLKNLIGGGAGAYQAATAETPQELKAGLYRAIGRSENYANKRAGIKNVEKDEGK